MSGTSWEPRTSWSVWRSERLARDSDAASGERAFGEDDRGNAGIAGPVQDRARAADEAIWLTLAAHEGALQEMLAARKDLQRLNAKLYQLGYGEGDGEHELQVAAPTAGG